MNHLIHIGTCSWNYPSWHPEIYSRPAGINFLTEYATHYNTVEIDRWYYAMPDPQTVREYQHAVSEDFLFTIKVPQMLTLTHQRQYKKTAQLLPNPDFLSVELFGEFLARLGPLTARVGMLIFQFEYLNQAKMKSLDAFLEALQGFFSQLETPVPIGIEIRNKHYLASSYFQFLQEYGLHHVFNQFHYMPPIWEVWKTYQNDINGRTLLRLLGGDRRKIETITNKQWNKVVLPKDDELDKIGGMIVEIARKDTMVFVNINNHFEGMAPATIRRLRERLNRQQ